MRVSVGRDAYPSGREGSELELISRDRIVNFLATSEPDRSSAGCGSYEARQFGKGSRYGCPYSVT